MELQCHAPFLILDLGHPMGDETVNVIKKSLHNVITLASLSFDNSSESVFGISVMSTDNTLIQPLNNLRKNYKSFTKKLDGLDKNRKTQKTTVQEYGKVLNNSLRKIGELKINFEKRNQKKCVCSHQSDKWQPEITIVTSKTAYILSEILMGTLRKWPAQEGLNNFKSIENFKIVQILSDEDESPGTCFQRISSIHWVTCRDGIDDLNCVFKDWLLRSSLEQEQLLLKFPKDIGLTIKCDVDVCVLEPTFWIFEHQFGLGTDFRHKKPGHILPLGKKAGTNDLQILHRIPLSSLNPKLIFGKPRRIYATRDHTSNLNERQTNLKIFVELCQQLEQSEQGLLVKSTFLNEDTETSFYYFIAPDDNTLMLYNIAPEELYLPKNSKFLKAHSQVDENITLTVRNSLHELQFLEKCSPFQFTSGLYELLKNYMTKKMKTQNLCMCPNPEKKLCVHKKRRAGKGSKDANPPYPTAVKNENSTLKDSFLEEYAHCGQSKKRGKRSSQYVHPALLSPNTVKKYRKLNPSLFTLPELGEAYDVNL